MITSQSVSNLDEWAAVASAANALDMHDNKMDFSYSNINEVITYSIGDFPSINFTRTRMQ